MEYKHDRTGNIGLGLSITREIIRTHNGEIWVQSKVGKGSTFNIRLPLKMSI
jgi:signal transduction histidine kinase